MQDILLIGIDGGATKVSGWQVIPDEGSGTFELGNFRSSKSYKEIPGFLPDFIPVDVPVQISQRDAGNIQLTYAENLQEAFYVEACAQVIEDLHERNRGKKILVGIGMPGLKTEDRRGICVLANGPRMLNYAKLLEEHLSKKSIELLSPVHHLGSDADYCGIGENYSVDGFFRNVPNAYYLGGGTGVADALKLNGKLIPFDATKDWLAKTWEFKSADGRSLERFTSVGGMQAVYAEMSGKKVSELNEKGIYPLQIADLAAKGDSSAQEMIKLAVENLSLVLFERIASLYSGDQGIFQFVNPDRAKLNKTHPYLGMVLDSIIVGQRLGELFETDSGKTMLRNPVMEKLAGLISNSNSLGAEAKKHYENLNNIIKSSKLREAPALGAGIDAYLTYKDN
jgi:predicted NBD/HSP70 family sugar kinase